MIARPARWSSRSRSRRTYGETEKGNEQPLHQYQPLEVDQRRHTLAEHDRQEACGRRQGRSGNRPQDDDRGEPQPHHGRCPPRHDHSARRNGCAEARGRRQGRSRDRPQDIDDGKPQPDDRFAWRHDGAEAGRRRQGRSGNCPQDREHVEPQPLDDFAGLHRQAEHEHGQAHWDNCPQDREHDASVERDDAAQVVVAAPGAGSARRPGSPSNDRRRGQMPSKKANVKNEKQYEALKDKGMSKQRAARIANSPGASSRGGKKSGSGSRSRSSSSQGGTTAQKKAAGRKGGKAAARKS
jgi:hypothetical protein